MGLGDEDGSVARGFFFVLGAGFPIVVIAVVTTIAIDVIVVAASWLDLKV